MELLLIFILSFFAVPSTVPGTVVTDWVGNQPNFLELVSGKTDSNLGINHKWVQNFTTNMLVLPDGTVYAYSDYDEAFRDIGIYKNGDVVGNFTAYGRGLFPRDGDLTSDGTYIYTTSRISFGSWVIDGYGIIRHNKNGTIAPFVGGLGDLGQYVIIRDTNNIIRNMTITCDPSTSELYVKADSLGKFYVYSTSPISQTVKDSFTLPLNVLKIKSDRNGKLWVLVNNEIRLYSNRGVYQNKKIVEDGTITTFEYCINNEIMVYNNTKISVTLYRQYGSSFKKRSFGIVGGTISTKGLIKPGILLPGLTGLGMDASGNLYFSWGKDYPSNTEIRSYSQNGSLRWNLSAHIFTGSYAFDEKTDGEYVFSTQHKYRMDYSKPLGKKWEFLAYQHDRRTDSGVAPGGGVYVRTLNGKRVLFKNISTLAAGGFRVYIEDGNLQKLVTTITSNTGTADWCWYVDTTGNIWYYSSSIQKYNYIGLVNGMPTWDIANPITFTRPTQFTEIRRLWYEPRTDEMYITGNSASNPKPTGEFGGLGTTMVKYSNWSSTKNIMWSRILELDTVSTQGHTPAAWYHAGDYIFYVAGVREPRPIYVISKETGLSIGNIYPSYHVGGDRAYHGSYGYLGVIDLVYSLTAMKRSNNAYYIFLENDLTARNFLYIWCPTSNCQNR